MEDLDRLDLEILAALEENARIPVSELARQLGAPSSTIRALTLSSARPALSSLFKRSMISGGVFLGTPMPAKPLAS